MEDRQIKFGVIANDEETGGGDLLIPSHDGTCPSLLAVEF
jgi:hypothetical protein